MVTDEMSNVLITEGSLALMFGENAGFFLDMNTQEVGLVGSHGYRDSGVRRKLTNAQAEVIRQFARGLADHPKPGDHVTVVFANGAGQVVSVVDSDGEYLGRADVLAGRATVNSVGSESSAQDNGWKFYHDDDDLTARWYFAVSPRGTVYRLIATWITDEYITEDFRLQEENLVPMTWGDLVAECRSMGVDTDFPGE